MDCVVSNTVLGEKHDILPERRMKKGKIKNAKVSYDWGLGKRKEHRAILF
jgi:hypothetical protein